MADPISAIAIGSTVLGGITSAAGSVYSGTASANMYTYQAGVAQANKAISLQNADYAKAVGEVQAQQAGMAEAQEVGKTKAVQGASGVDVNVGSAKLVRDSEAEIGEYNQALIHSDAAKRAYGYDVEAMNQQSQSDIYKMSASKSQTAGYLGAAGSLLGTAGSVSSKWLQGGSIGTLPSAALTKTGVGPY